MSHPDIIPVKHTVVLLRVKDPSGYYYPSENWVVDEHTNLITSPGMYEGEHWTAPYFHRLVGEGPDHEFFLEHNHGTAYIAMLVLTDEDKKYTDLSYYGVEVSRTEFGCVRLRFLPTVDHYAERLTDLEQYEAEWFAQHGG